MSFFSQPKPRGSITSRYTTMSIPTGLRTLRGGPARNLALIALLSPGRESLRGVFTNDVREKRQRRGMIKRNALINNTGAVIVIILVLLLFWIYLSK